MILKIDGSTAKVLLHEVTVNFHSDMMDVSRMVLLLLHEIMVSFHGRFPWFVT